MKIICPACRTVLEDVPDDFAARPFCCMRCKLADLANWMNETYRISRPLAEEDLDERLN